MRRVAVTAACIGVLVISLAAASLAVRYEIHDLGDWSAAGINDSNVIVGTDDGRVVTWADGSVRSLFDGYATDINNAGQILGTNNGIPFVWQHYTMDYLPVPTHPYIPEIYTNAYSINDVGQVAGSTWGASSPPEFKTNSAVIWDNGGLVGLWSSPYWMSAVAYDINNSGVAVGTDGRGYARGAGWYFQIVQSCAYAINDGGEVVGTYGYGAPYDGYPIFYEQYPNHGFRYRGGNWWDLNTLGGTTSTALDINNSGWAVGHSTLPDGTTHACVWHYTTPFDLGTLGGSGESEAYHINENGWIIGSSNGRAVLWTPVPEPVPDCSTLATALMCCASGLAFRRRRR